MDESDASDHTTDDATDDQQKPRNPEKGKLDDTDSIDNQSTQPTESQEQNKRFIGGKLIEFSDREEEKFIELQCEFEPHEVCNFLKTHKVKSDAALRVVSNYNIWDAMAYIHEIKGISIFLTA